MEKIREMNKQDYEITFEDFPIKIPQGEYQAVCYKAVYSNRCWGGRITLYLRFRIIDHEMFDGVELFMACPVHKKKLNYRCKLFQQYSLATGRKPDKSSRFNKNVLLNRVFLIGVRDSVRKDKAGNLLSPDEQYSVVGTIIEPLTGPIA